MKTVIAISIIVGLILFILKRSKKKSNISKKFIAPSEVSKSKEQPISFEFFTDASDKKLRLVEQLKCGDRIKLWNPKGSSKIIAFQSGTIGGDGKIDELPPEVARKILPYLQSGKSKYATIIDTKYNRVKALYSIN